MNITVLTTRLFGTPRQGGELCSARLLDELLQDGHRVQWIGRGPLPAAVPAGVQACSVGRDVTPFDTQSRLQQAASLAAAWLRGEASTVHRLAAGGVPGGVRRAMAARQPPDLLVVDHLQTWAWLPPAVQRRPATLVLMHNLESDGYDEQERAARSAGHTLRAAVLAREARLLRRLERHMLQHATVVACLSDADAAVLRERARAIGSKVQVEVLPGYPRREGPPASRPPTSASCRIGMLGTWTWAPNRAGLQWMLAHVLPLLPPHGELVLAGSGAVGSAWPAGVRWLGRVDEVREFYDAVDVVAVPSFSGSGVQEKAIEAVVAARAVVATPHALRGLGPGLPPHVHVATEPAAFARACVEAAASRGDGNAAATRAWADERRQRYRQALARCLSVA